MQNLVEKFYVYKGHKIYEPQIFTNIYGQKYWNYCPFQMSSIPPNGYPSKEAYYKAEQQRIDKWINMGNWTDNFGPLLK